MKNGTILKQSFDSTVMRHNLCRNEDFETIEQCVDIADNYAIEFVEWIQDNTLRVDLDKYKTFGDTEETKPHTLKELLQIFKKKELL